MFVVDVKIGSCLCMSSVFLLCSRTVNESLRKQLSARPTLYVKDLIFVDETPGYDFLA